MKVLLSVKNKFKFKKKSCPVKLNRRERILTTTTENDPFFFLTSDSILFTTNVGGPPSSSDPSNVFSSIFSNIFNNIIEVDRFNEAVQNSMETYNEELFKKVDDHTIDLPIVQSIPSSSRVSACFICTAELDPVADEDLFETTDKKNGFYELPCHHVYHASCLQEAVAHQHYKCCLCQEKIPLVSKEEKPCTATIKEEEYNQNGHRITISSSFLDYPD